MPKKYIEVCGCTNALVDGCITSEDRCFTCDMLPCLVEEEKVDVEEEKVECTIIHGKLRPFTYHVIRVDAVHDLDKENVQVGGLYRYYDLNGSDNSIMVVYDYETDEGHILFYPELTVIAYEEKA